MPAKFAQQVLSHAHTLFIFYLFIYLFIYLFLLFRAALVAYGGSQVRGLIGAVAAGLCHSHCNAGSEPRLRPTLQLTATLDPTEHGQGLKLQPHGC